MSIATTFIRAAKEHPKVRQHAQDFLGMLYNTLFRFQSSPAVTSDKVQISTFNRNDCWYEDACEIRQYIAKQNPEGLWDVQRVSNYSQNLESWTNREMVRLGASIETVRTLFATQNRMTSPSGREIVLKNAHEADSALSRGGKVRTDYSLRQVGNYREHPEWSPSKAPDQHPGFTP